MELKLNTTFYRYGLIFFTLYAWGLIAWDFFHEGVPTHYLLHDENMPGISNWWGAIIIPLVSYISLLRIQRRQSLYPGESNRKLLTRFLMAVAFGITLSILFFLLPEVIDYLMLTLFVLSFWVPLYKTEFYLGFVVGALYTFGSFIPSLAGLILVGIYFLFHTIGKRIKKLILSSE